MKFTAKHGDFVLGILAILGGIVILILTKVQGLELVKSNKMGPGFFPTICGIAITLCGILILIELWHKQQKAKTSNEVNEALAQPLFDIHELKNLILFAALGVFVLLLADYIGLLTCLGLCVIAYLKIQGKESWLKSIIIGVCMVAFLYAVFVMFLRVPVPKGPLGF